MTKPTSNQVLLAMMVILLAGIPISAAVGYFGVSYLNEMHDKG